MQHNTRQAGHGNHHCRIGGKDPGRVSDDGVMVTGQARLSGASLILSGWVKILFDIAGAYLHV